MVAEMSLRRWGNLGVERVRKVEMIAGILWSCGRIAGARSGADDAGQMTDASLEQVKA